MSCGREARERLAQYIGGRAVRCEDNGPDPVFRRRRICVCTVEGETMSINKWLVREGLAIKFEPFARGRFQEDEDEARQSRRGLWKGCFVAPQHLRYWRKLIAPLLGSTCANEPVRATSCSLTIPRCHRAARLRASSQCAPGHGLSRHLSSRRLSQLPHPQEPQPPVLFRGGSQAAGFRRALTCRGTRAG
jgi:hypothetical protein